MVNDIFTVTAWVGLLTVGLLALAVAVAALTCLGRMLVTRFTAREAHHRWQGMVTLGQAHDCHWKKRLRQLQPMHMGAWGSIPHLWAGRRWQAAAGHLLGLNTWCALVTGISLQIAIQGHTWGLAPFGITVAAWNLILMFNPYDHKRVLAGYGMMLSIFVLFATQDPF